MWYMHIFYILYVHIFFYVFNLTQIFISNFISNIRTVSQDIFDGHVLFQRYIADRGEREYPDY